MIHTRRMRALAAFRAADPARLLLRFTVVFRSAACLFAMIELNPVRSQIADLTERLDALRGYL
ncbi:MAG TPA: hypothetical protein PKE36_03760 [Chiayiivirga sp.]|nr:hypothetical protein [Chiayiivirga sp.]HRO86643.1 hypothetical protein [Chiayiivirga sp.]HRQ34536.1 hypothetical protein [Chiayiivirga sp.]